MTFNPDLQKPVNDTKALSVYKFPADWNLKPARGLFRWREDLGGERDELLSLSSEYGVRKPVGLRGRAASLDLSKYRRVRPGDLVVNRLIARDGALAVSLQEGLVSPAYWVLETDPEILNSRYCHYLMRSKYSLDQISERSKYLPPAQFDILWQDFRAITYPIPSIADQIAIGRYLDWANGQLDKAIRAKRKLIALLNEQKQAVIHRAVTRGINSSVRLKPSGIDWLGDIPTHWDVVPSKSLFKHRREKARDSDLTLTASQTHGIISRDTFMALEGRRVMQVLTGLDILKHIEPNDFVMSMRSFEGGLEWSRIGGCVSSAYVALIPTEKVHFPYFAYALKCKSYIMDLRRTSDLVRDGQALRYANFGKVALPLIPITEQIVISVYLDGEVAELNDSISHLEREVGLLKEYRIRLVDDVVTGKLDVRKVAARLPDEVLLGTVEDTADRSEDLDSADEEAAV